jgi:hypothetical protein
MSEGVMPSAAPAPDGVVRAIGWPLRTRVGRLPLSPRSVRLLWFALAVVGLVPILTAPTGGWHDWPSFWSAGATVGSPNLMDYQAHTAWQTAHGLPADPWRYPPAVAYLFWPASLVPLGFGFAVNACLMLALVALAGVLVARTFDLPGGFGVRLALAWTPALAAVNMGQNMPIAVVLALWAIDALRRGDDLGVGIACGLLMYKPTLGLPLVALLVIRRQWRSTSFALVVVAAGYGLSILAAAGDWLWPVAWWNGIQPWLSADFAYNADKTVSIPGLLLRLGGLPAWLPYVVGGSIALLAIRGLVRAPVVEAASAACLIAMAAGPRVWSYEAGMMLPILGWTVAGGVAEPWRTRLVYAAIPLGLMWWLSPLTKISGVAVVLCAAAFLWIWRWRPFGPVPKMEPVRPPAA